MAGEDLFLQQQSFTMTTLKALLEQILKVTEISADTVDELRYNEIHEALYINYTSCVQYSCPICGVCYQSSCGVLTCTPNLKWGRY